MSISKNNVCAFPFPFHTVREVWLRVRGLRVSQQIHSELCPSTHSTSNEQDGVWVNRTADTLQVDFARDGVDGNEVNLDVEVLRGLLERCVS